jgi:hypothetical protein
VRDGYFALSGSSNAGRRQNARQYAQKDRTAAAPFNRDDPHNGRRSLIGNDWQFDINQGTCSGIDPSSVHRLNAIRMATLEIDIARNSSSSRR